ncbi:MAG: hypothetical protein FD129_2710 [bacterium]|nr:MAG: hypothetical protein FD129_2710 [bacterium]
MKRHETVDPKIDKLVAALYGEMTDAERRDFDNQLRTDSALRAEWEEISGTRSLLSGWELEERVPSFLVVDAGRQPRRAPASGWLDALRDRFGNWFSIGGWVVAGAAAAVLILALRGVQLQRTDGGFQVTVGPNNRPVARELVNPLGAVPQQVSGNGDIGANPSSYLTREEFDQYSAAMLRMVSAYMNEYRGRRDDEIGAALRSLYGDINAKQSSQYEDLLGKIDARHPEALGARDILRPMELGMSHADSLGPLRQSPEDVEVGRNE